MTPKATICNIKRISFITRLVLSWDHCDQVPAAHGPEDRLSKILDELFISHGTAVRVLDEIERGMIPLNS